MNEMNTIAELLPEGISEETLVQVAELVSSTIEEEEQEVSVLTEELNRLVTDNELLENTATVLSTKIEALEEAVYHAEDNKENLVEEIKTLEASQEKPFKSSEQALMVSEENNGVTKRTADNEFLTSEVMKFMPFDTSK